MDPLNQIEINLNTDQLFWLNICLAFLMFGVALEIRTNDFKEIFKQPRAVITGLLSQWVLLPLLTFLLIIAVNPHPGIALGMMLVAACPGGNISNFLVHLSDGNRALSVTLTSVTTIFAFLITPFNMIFWGSMYAPSREILQQFSLSPSDLLWILTQLVLIPLTLGMLATSYLPVFTTYIKKYVKWLSVAVFMGIVIGAILANSDNLVKYLQYVFVLVLIHNGLAYLSGFVLSRISRLKVRETRTIMIESGIQNSGLGLIIIFNFYNGMSSMALVAAWWAIWHLISGFSLAWWWHSRRVEELVV